MPYSTQPARRARSGGPSPQRAEECTDASRIEARFDRALTATTLDQVFAG
ncbi:MAG TPA: hypothetical protein VMG38_13535 [Trebonia sp.]|nr:hypothetical protein [Trebonia sp.]